MLSCVVLCVSLLQLLTPSFMLSKTNGRDAISRGDLEEADSLFHDAKYSARMLHEQADKYIT
jgi:RuvB-like protein 1 (pontin 52)